ncbi:hypothetical protein GCM10009866_30230 [Cellulomonas aerilata]
MVHTIFALRMAPAYVGVVGRVRPGAVAGPGRSRPLATAAGYGCSETVLAVMGVGSSLSPPER